jgi:hypothetical protein
LSACGGPSKVAVTLPAHDDRCPALMSELPRDLGADLHPRSTSPASTSARAWGSPAVVVVCGGYRPPHDLDRDARERSAQTGVGTYRWTSPEEGADPTIYRIDDPSAPYVVVTLPHSVVPVTALGPIVDALNAARYPTR